jgi:cellulose synthase (UDP-forming)
MEQQKNPGHSTVIETLGILAIMATLTYMIVRGVLLQKAQYAAMDGAFAVLILSAEGLIMFHGIGYAINILWSRKRARRMSALLGSPRHIKEGEWPPVAILIPARHEPRKVLEETFITVNNIDYPNKRVYFLDDSIKEQYNKEAEELSRDYNLTLFRRTKPWHGSKAGIINDFLEQVTEKYIAVFDADDNPLPDFLKPLVSIMEGNEKTAFIQTPQFYSNIDENRIARVAVLQQAVFYEYICESKGTVDSMFCCGTNVLLRVSALRAIGGMDEATVTEDFATSFVLHTHGFSSIYYSHVCAFGMGPEDLIGYFTQQFRWAAGTLHVFKKMIVQFFTKPFSLKPGQWFQYLLSSTFYLVGFGFFILMLGPIFYIFFRVPSFYGSPYVYFLAYVPYVLLSTSVFYSSLQKRNYKPQDLMLGQLLGAITCFVYMQAALAVLLGVKISFGITAKGKGGAIPWRMLWPQLGMVTVTLAAVVWAANRFVYEHNPALFVNGFWAFWHFLTFMSVFYFNRGTK